MSDTRRDQLIDFVEKEFIGPDPIDWPEMTQANGEEILKTDPPRTRYIAGILYPRATMDGHVDVREGESEPLGEDEESEREPEPVRHGGQSPEFLENAEELINLSNAYRQSAVSITAAVKPGDVIRVEVSACTYVTLTVTDPKTEKKITSYPRTALSWNNDGVPVQLPDAANGLVKIPVRATGLQFDITYRYHLDGSNIYWSK